MINDKSKKIFIYIVLVLFVFALDRVSKSTILNILDDTGKVDIYINSFFSLFLVWNKGIGFGLFSFDQTYIYNGITLFILLINLIIVYLILREKNINSYFLSLILGGSLGNLFDRYYYGAVPDFIDLNYNGYHWFIFNVADIFITIGIICLILGEFLNYKKQNEKK
jgi:signal peptidase II|tara:strand:+ start:231 stop:728 length:498 start_codon:yes stop_codon:yes gene_type:complete